MLKTVPFQDQTVYEISDASSVVRVAPQHGARLLDWKVAGKPIIYWPEQTDWSRAAHVRGGNPILFPFIARHMVNGKIGWWIDENGTKRELPMHGFARNASFEVIEEKDPSTLRMRMLPSEQTREWYPFEFVFDVVYRLIGKSLETRLEVTNTGDKPMPYYMGHHYYFSVPHEERGDWKVSIPCERRGRQQPNGDIDEVPATATEFELSDASLSDTMQIALKSSKLSLLHKKSCAGVDIDLDAGGNVPWYAVTTWTEKPDSDFYCVEPWTGLPNAIHHHKGLRHLAPGKKENAVCVIHVRP